MFDEEIGLMTRAIGERDDGLVVFSKKPKRFNQQIEPKISAPERAVIARILDDRARVADERGVESELMGDGERAAVASASAENGLNPSASRAGDGFRRARPEQALAVEEGAVDIEREHPITPFRRARSGREQVAWFHADENARDWAASDLSRW